MDLGADNYALEEYFSSRRFSYYRKNTRGHNTLMFGGRLQATGDCGGYTPGGHAAPSTSATFLATFSSLSGSAAPAPAGHALLPCALAAGEQACASVDLSPAYEPPGAGGAAAVSRRVALRAAGSLRVDDAWAFSATSRPENVTAAFHTLAEVAIAPDGQSAALTRGDVGATLTLLRGGCHGARLVATPVRLAPPQDSTNSVTRVDAVADAPGATCTGWAFELALA
jgi:hypothetical protein